MSNEEKIKEIVAAIPKELIAAGDANGIVAAVNDIGAKMKLHDPIDIPEFLKPRPAPLSVLDEAKAIVEGPRAADYGSATEGFGRTAAMWSAYLGITISTKDCAAMFALNKLSREKGKHKRDNLVDLAGYAEVMRKIEDGE